MRNWVFAGTATGAIALVCSGCMGADTALVRGNARPHADAHLADAPSLLPPMPIASTTTTRGQSGDIVPASTAGGGQIALKIRASVNGIPILEDEVREALAPYVGELMQAPESQRAAVLRKISERELNRLIERELILEEAFVKLKAINRPQVIEQLKTEAAKEGDKRIREIKNALKIESDEQFKAILIQQGLSVNGLRRAAERSFMMMEYVRNLIYPTVQRIGLQQIRDYYEKHGDEFRSEDTVTWQGMFIDSSKHANPAAARQHAEGVLARVRKGEDFAKLAQEFDDGDSKLRGGAGLGTKRGEILPNQAEPLVWSLKADEASLLDMGFGFHLVKIVTREVAGQKPFDVPCQAEIKKKLQNIVAEREYKRLVDDLKRRATITIN